MSYLDKKWRITLFYTTAPAGVAILSHEMKFFVNVTGGVAPGGDLDEFVVTKRNTTTTDLTDYMLAFEVPNIIPNYAATDNFNRIELWAAEIGSDNYDFYSSSNIDEDGTAGGLAALNHQTTLTFRAANGKTGRAQLMEDVSTSLSRVSFNDASVAQQDLAALINSGDSARVTYDFSYFISTIFINGSNSDAIEKKRFR